MSLTVNEREIVGELGRLWKRIGDEVVGDGPSRSADLDEVIFHIHALQNFVLSQSAARTYPNEFRLAGLTLTEDPDEDESAFGEPFYQDKE